MNNSYCVYRHVFPNEKCYIGISKQAEKRWRNGLGYDSQPKMANAIQKYGWANVKHEVIASKLTKELALELERHYIAEYNSIQNGYNVSIGGENFNETYLNPYVLEMVRGMRSIYPGMKSLANIAHDERLNKEAAGWWNEASKAVTAKHGRFSSTDELEVAQYWYYIGQYMELDIKLQNGEDVSAWKEKPFEVAVWDAFFGNAPETHQKDTRFTSMQGD